MSFVTCPHCGGSNTTKKGWDKTQTPPVRRYLCKPCEKRFNDPTVHTDTSGGLEDSGNTATATIKGLKPKTLDDLIKFCKIDLKTWSIDRWVGNTWTVTNAAGVSYLNHQVKAWLVRNDPVKHRWPQLSPVKSSFKKPKTTPPKRGGFRKALIIPDSQTGYLRDTTTGNLDPFHDRAAFDVVCQVAERERPDVICMLGDMFDFPMFSDKYKKSPEFYFTTQPALEENHAWFRRLANTGAEIHYFEGNHEMRLRDLTIANTIESYGLKPANQPEAPPAVSVEHLAGLDSLGVIYHGNYPHGEYWLNDNLRVSHGVFVRSGGGKTVEAVVKDARNSEIFGHIHRLESAHKTVHPRGGPKTYGAYSCGTIARLDSGIVPSNATRQDWQQGLSIVNFEEGNGLFEVLQYPIFGGVAIVNGYKYKSRPKSEIVSWLNQCTNWKY